MSTNSSQSLIIFFIRKIFLSALMVLAGFAIAPTHLLYSFYEAHSVFRAIAIFAGVLTTIFGLFYILTISLKIIEGRIAPNS
jgi:hypothetical protein